MGAFGQSRGVEKSIIGSVMHIETINPATGRFIKRYSLNQPDEIRARIELAHSAFQSWRKTSFEQRACLMKNMAQLLREEKDVFAQTIVQEMGKPLSSALSEIEKCAWVCEHYAEQAPIYLAPSSIKTQYHKSRILYEPLGVVFAIMPWNFPFWQVFRYAAPTLMAGNTTLLKHAPITTGSALLIESLFKKVGFPEGVFQSLILRNEDAESVIAHPSVVAVTLTGSGRAGSSVASIAGQYLKRVVLELGGNDPYLVLADADLSLAARAIVDSRLNNAGQSCVAAKRIIVVEAVYDSFIGLLMQEMERYTLGDPQLSTTTMGPIARADLRETLHEQVLKSQAKGALILKGGVFPKTEGFYYPPTLLVNVKPGMPAFDDELFGPVLAVIRAEDETSAIALANQSKFGLGSGVFTRDLARGEKIASEAIEAGSCFVNGFVSSDPRLPFGGIKQSGYGRELSSAGILEFVNIKTIVIHDGCGFV
jgi:succinate-semialdehyde dehydrogenase / glutarate-semialdehyde dehydrogenase